MCGYLSRALEIYYREQSSRRWTAYSDLCLRRVWKAERFSWWFTSLMHRFPDTGEFGQKIQEAELDYLVHSKAASTSLAENYVGLPLEDFYSASSLQAVRKPGASRVCTAPKSRSASHTWAASASTMNSL
jgi:hypothetical protein